MSSLAQLILAASKTRKEREGGSDRFKAPPNKTRPDPLKPGYAAHSEPPPPALPSKNRILAGYLAHEFLTKGTLLGRPFDPAQSEPVKLVGPVQNVYADVAHLVKLDGTHIPGIVNPTQLERWVRNGARGET